MNSIWGRMGIFVLLFVVSLVIPWWLTLAVVITLSIYFPLYIEAMVFGFMFDNIYAVDLSFPYPALASAFVFLMVVMYVKEQIRT